MKTMIDLPDESGTGPRVHWVTVDGGVPPGLDLSDRAATHTWIEAERTDDCG